MNIQQHHEAVANLVGFIFYFLNIVTWKCQVKETQGIYIH